MTDKPIHLPLIVAAPTFTADNPALTGGGVPQTITVQLTTQRGQHYLVPLSVDAAQAIVAGLLRWQPVRDAVRHGGNGQD
jgi:hypothetical protein